MSLVNNFLTATVDVTTRCNLHCRHCRTHQLHNEMTLGNLDFVSHELANCGVKSVFLSGGEPLVRDDIVSVVRVFKRRIREITLNTNGTLLTSELLEELLTAGVNCMQFSLDGLEAEHDQIRGTGQYQRTIHGIRLSLACRKKPEIHISTCVSMLNINSLDKFVKCIIEDEKLFVDVICFKRFVPKNEMSDRYRLGKEGLRRLTNQVNKLSRTYDGRVIVAMDAPIKNLSQKEVAERVREKYNLTMVGCSAGRGPCIRADGTISPCSMIDAACGNILFDGMQNAYMNSVMEKLCTRDLGGHCGVCKSRLICGGCRAVAEAYSGDCLSEDPECFLW